MPLFPTTPNEHSVTIRLAPDEVAATHKIHKEPFGRFQAIGEIDNMHTLGKTPLKTDIFNLLESISKSAFGIFNALKCRRDPRTNLASYCLDNPTKSQQVVFYRGLAELKAKGIVVKARTINELKPVPKHCYMINPFLLKAQHTREAEITWFILNGGKVQPPTTVAEFIRLPPAI